MPRFIALRAWEGGTDTVRELCTAYSLRLYHANISMVQTVSSLGTFMLAMTKYPDVLREAQKEIDEVVGQDRLPEFDDRPSLPYVTAIVKEVARREE